MGRRWPGPGGPGGRAFALSPLAMPAWTENTAAGSLTSMADQCCERSGGAACVSEGSRKHSSYRLWAASVGVPCSAQMNGTGPGAAQIKVQAPALPEGPGTGGRSLVSELRFIALLGITRGSAALLAEAVFIKHLLCTRPGLGPGAVSLQLGAGGRRYCCESPWEGGRLP